TVILGRRVAPLVRAEEDPAATWPRLQGVEAVTLALLLLNVSEGAPRRAHSLVRLGDRFLSVAGGRLHDRLLLGRRRRLRFGRRRGRHLRFGRRWGRRLGFERRWRRKLCFGRR